MSRVRLPQTIKIGLFEQGGGWIFIVSRDNFHGDSLASGKRNTLESAMDAARASVPKGHPIVFTRLDNIHDWTL